MLLPELRAVTFPVPKTAGCSITRSSRRLRTDGRPAQVSVSSLLPLACAFRAPSRILSSVRTRREI